MKKGQLSIFLGMYVVRSRVTNLVRIVMHFVLVKD
jgi:hypothetical protein